MPRFSRKQRQVLSRECRAKGWEITPDQYEAEFDSALAMIQTGMRARGHDLSDDELIVLMAEAKRREAFEDRISRLIESFATEAKPWGVVDKFGGVAKRYVTRDEARRDALHRNVRATKFGVEPCYRFVDLTIATA